MLHVCCVSHGIQAISNPNKTKRQKQGAATAVGSQVRIHMVIHISSSGEPVVADLCGFVRVQAEGAGEQCHA